MTEDPYAGRCGTCGAFMRMHEHETLGQVGDCGLEVYPPPVKATATCSRYRPKGGSAPAERPRVPGEPRRNRTSSGQAAPRRRMDEPILMRRPLPQEIDIDMDINEFRRVLREVLSEELGLHEVELGRRWQGGEMVLKPGSDDTQEKSVPIESFFHKIVMIRDKLRVLEAKLNGHKVLSDEEKVQLQAYITACYGTLTTFNVMFANREDNFSTKG
jgi:hypothetical protein